MSPLVLSREEADLVGLLFDRLKADGHLRCCGWRLEFLADGPVLVGCLCGLEPAGVLARGAL